ncbi:MAG: glutamate racemase [Alphaproteobacteria bacterium]|nr:glutamate racemase [Alphaproteobacteria bacterium]
MKLGIFDSGLGGLLIAAAISRHLPDIDTVYFGDTLHVPYGNRSLDAIYSYSKTAMDFLFDQDCALIIVACNTVSASALRRLQQEYLPQKAPDRRILGVVVPTLETAIDRGYKNLGVIATNHIVQSGIYEQELQKLDPSIRIHHKATPLLVPLIENDGLKWAPPILEEYLSPLTQKQIECLILGCTHYPFLKKQIADISGPSVDLLSQDEIIPEKLADYLRRHPEISSKLDRHGQKKFFASDMTESYAKAANTIYGKQIEIQRINLHE